MRHSGRWQLTDVQRLGVVAAVVTSLFLAAMALGKGSLVLLLAAVLLLVVVGLGIFLIGMRLNDRAGVIDGHVVRVSPPPRNQIVGRCDLRLVVDLPGRPTADVKVRDSSVPVTKWPRVGQVLPVDVDARRRQLRIRWDLVDNYLPQSASPMNSTSSPTRDASAPAPTPRLTPTEQVPDLPVPIYTDYADNGGDPEYSPTPPSSYREEDATYSPTPGEVAPHPEDAPLVLDPTLHRGADWDRITDAEVVDETGPAERAEASGFELPLRGTTIPQPRPANRPITSPPVDAATVADPSTAMGVMLVVSDLTRSVHFYRDLVGFELLESATTTAVLTYGGGTVLLRQLADMSPVDRRVAHLHIQVPDVEAAYEDLRAKGVAFAHKPRIINRADRRDLWAATCRDPDGHDVALTQWRDREDAAPGR